MRHILDHARMPQVSYCGIPITELNLDEVEFSYYAFRDTVDESIMCQECLEKFDKYKTWTEYLIRKRERGLGRIQM